MRQYRSVVITGASGGIGRALVEELAEPGVRFLLLGRNAARLEQAAATAQNMGAIAEMSVCDVTDSVMLSDCLVDFDARHGVDLLIANAGMTAGLGPDGAPESSGSSQRTINVNLLGVINAIEPLLPAMIARRSGQIALVSSLAGLRPHADLPSYSASKSGVRAYGVALRGWLRRHQISVCVITPGFVTSPMSARHHGPKPFELPAGKAAKTIVNGLKRGRPMITFPWQLVLMARLGNLLPARVSDWFERRFVAVIIPENDEPA